MDQSIEFNASYRVIQNDEQQYMIWPSAELLPVGWIESKVLGSKDRCMRYIRDCNSQSESDGDIVQLAVNTLDVESIPDCIERIAIARCEKTALSFGDESLNYRELNAWTNKVADSLISKGVVPESIVGLLFDRSLELVVSIIATIKVGAAYLPLVPDLPERRLKDQIDEARAAILLTPGNLISRARAIFPSGERIFVVGNENRSFARPATNSELEYWFERNPERSELNGENIINVIFTSGSTGKPKGVANRYSSIFNRLRWMIEEYKLTDDEIVLHKTPISFDVSGWELLLPLMVGAKMVIALPDGHKDPLYIADLIYREKITSIHFVPSMLFAFLADESSYKKCGSLRRIFTSGEELSLALLRRCHDRLPCALHNLYGPTEAAIDVTYWDATRNWDSAVPIGIPIQGCQVFVLNQNMDIVPDGQEGELYLGGIGLARGYCNSSALTAEKFIPNPFSIIPGERLYRTGDLARINSNGLIEYLGRIDTQLKIRGQRIELTEIENRLNEHANIHQSAVIALRSEFNIGIKLIGFYVPTSLNVIDHKSLCAHLKSYLPDYMVPLRFFEVESLPLSPNGKLDRVSLAERAREQEDNLRATNLPKISKGVSLSEILRNIWFETIGFPLKSESDNFFESGGDSIQVLLFVAKARSSGINISTSDLYGRENFGDLLKFVNDHDLFLRTSKLSKNPIAVSPRTDQQIPLTPIQHWFFEKSPIGLSHWNQSFLLKSKFRLKTEIVERAFSKLLARHDVFSMRFDDSKGYWRALYDNEPMKGELRGNFRCIQLNEMPDSLDQFNRECSNLQKSLDIKKGRLAALGVFSGAMDDGDALLFVIHHLVVDGVSWRILLADFEQIYLSLLNDTFLNYESMSLSYGDWAIWLNGFANRQEFSCELNYWRSVCDEMVSEEMPRRNDPNAANNNLGSELRIYQSQLSREATEVLLNSAPKYYQAHINEIFLAALAIVLSKAMKSEKVRINLEGHGREDISGAIDISRTVGWFTTIFPMNLSVAKHSTPHVVLSDVKDKFRSLPKKGFSYSVLRYLLSREMKEMLVVNPDVTFNYLGKFDSLFETSNMLAPLFLDRGAERDRNAQRFEVIYVEAACIGGNLKIDWHFNEKQFCVTTIQECALEFQSALEMYIDQFTKSRALAQLRGSKVLKWEGLVDPKVALELNMLYADIETVTPLLPLQQGMLFHTMLSEDPTTYAVEARVEIEGELDTSRLLDCWREVESSYDILRCRIALVGEVPLLVFLKHSECSFDVLVESDLAPFQAMVPLATDDVPMLSVKIMRIADTHDSDVQRWIFSFVHSHILLDGTSVRLILNDLFSRYVSQTRIETDVMMSTKSFSSLVQHQIGVRAAQTRFEDKRFWTDWVASLNDLNILPITDFFCIYSHSARYHALVDDFSRYNLENVGLGRFSRFTKEALSPIGKLEIQRSARKLGVTSASLFYASWAILLCQLYDSHEVLFLTTHSLRSPDFPSFEASVGMSLNTLPVRISLDPNLLLGDWCRGVAENLAVLKSHGNIALYEISEGRQDLREKLGATISLVNIESYANQLNRNWESIKVINFDSVELPNHNLTFNVKWDDVESTYSIQLLFDNSIFSDDQSRAILARFELILEKLVSVPNVSLDVFMKSTRVQFVQ